jgi:CRP-like cAMP-binding protein
MVEGGLLSRHGSRGGPHDRLASSVARRLGVQMRELKHPYIDDLRARALVLQAASDMGEIANREVQELLDVDRHKAMRILARMVQDGELRRKGSRRWARYVPRGKPKG